MSVLYLLCLPELAHLEAVACERCKDVGDDEELLLCDSRNCNRGYHLGCLTPVLTEVPDGDWFCPMCTSAPCKVGSLTLFSLEFCEALAVSCLWVC
jgi:hypothetical protein